MKIGNHNYRAGRIDARKQFHIVRRMAPFLEGLAKVKTSGAASLEEAGLAALPEMAAVLARMDDETADYVLFGLLAPVRREQENGLGWAPVCSGNTMAFDDISMAQMLQLAGESLRENLGDFFVILKSASGGASPTA